MTKIDIKKLKEIIEQRDYLDPKETAERFFKLGKELGNSKSFDECWEEFDKSRK